MPPITEDAILDVLDQAQSDDHWPCLGNMNIDHITARLIAFRDDNRWALLFNLVSWSSGGRIESMIEPIGNCINLPVSDEHRKANEEQERYYAEHVAPKNRQMTQMFGTDRPMGKVAAMLGVQDAMGDWDEAIRKSQQENLGFMAKQLNTVVCECDEEGGLHKVTIRGKSVELPGIDAESEYDPDFLRAVAIVDRHRDLVLATGSEVAKFFVGSPPPQLLLLDDWHHADHELPSNVEAYQLLARALATGNAGAYRPTEEPNTRWQNWIGK